MISHIGTPPSPLNTTKGEATKNLIEGETTRFNTQNTRDKQKKHTTMRSCKLVNRTKQYKTHTVD